MEMLQKRALRIMQPDLSYAEALVALDITSLYERRKALSNALFDTFIVANSLVVILIISIFQVGVDASHFVFYCWLYFTFLVVNNIYRYL